MTGMILFVGSLVMTLRWAVLWSCHVWFMGWVICCLHCMDRVGLVQQPVLATVFSKYVELDSPICG